MGRTVRLLNYIMFACLVSLPAVQPSLANAADTPSDNILPYKHTMRCAAYNLFMAGMLEKEGEAEAKSFFDDGARWLTMAYARDGEEGKKADRDLDVVIDKLIEKINTQDEIEIEKFLTKINGICSALAAENAEEFNSISLEEETEKP